MPDIEHSSKTEELTDVFDDVWGKNPDTYRPKQAAPTFEEHVRTHLYDQQQAGTRFNLSGIRDPFQAGRNAGIFSIFTLVYSSSFETIIGSPRRCGTSTETTSSLYFPESQAAAERLYDCIANAS